MGSPGTSPAGHLFHRFLYQVQVRLTHSECVRQAQGFHSLQAPWSSSLNLKDIEYQESRCRCRGLGDGQGMLILAMGKKNVWPWVSVGVRGDVLAVI